ncbi:MAG: T9SS type A sorting domain-containing protein, partial [Cyclobacteriaceae bacterium]
IVAKPIDDQLVNEGFTSLELDLSGTFSDADGDALDLEVQLGHVDVIAASLSQNTLMLTEKGIGTTTVTVTASDGKGGLATETFEVVVNGIPIVAKPIDDQLVNEGFTSLELDLSGTFSDADGDALDLEVQLAHGDVIGASLSQNTLMLTEKSIGTTIVTVTASDGKGGQAMEEFQVVVAEILGLEEGSTSIQVYPNPTSGRFTLELKTPLKLSSIELFNLDAKRIDYQLIDFRENQMTLQIPHDVRGILSLQIRFGKTLVTRKLIVR